MWFGAGNGTFNWYLFELIVLIKPDVNCLSNFLFWVDKFTTGT